MSSISRDVPLIFSTATLLLHFARLSNYLLNEHTNKRSIIEVLITSHFVSYNSGKKKSLLGFLLTHPYYTN